MDDFKEAVPWIDCARHLQHPARTDFQSGMVGQAQEPRQSTRGMMDRLAMSGRGTLTVDPWLKEEQVLDVDQ